MIAIKNWYLDKNHMRGLRGVEFTVVKETEKALLLRYDGCEWWFPKSVTCKEWEKDTSALGYHDYLVETYNTAYYNGEMGEVKTFKSGRNVYDGASFTHQMTSKELINSLTYLNVKFMSKEEWINR